MQQLGAVLEQQLFDLLVGADIGTAKAVDGLLRIPDDEQLPGNRHDAAPVAGRGITGREQDKDLRLQRVRVLELVDEKMGEALLEMLANAGGLDEQIAGADEQV